MWLSAQLSAQLRALLRAQLRALLRAQLRAQPRAASRSYACSFAHLRAASRSFFSPSSTMTWNSAAVAFNSSSRSASALTMSRSLLAAALGGMSCRPSRSLRRAAASPRAVEALVSMVARKAWRKAGFFSPALALFAGEDLKSRGGFAVRPSPDELSARQARTQARELDTEKRIRFLCLAGGT